MADSVDQAVSTPDVAPAAIVDDSTASNAPGHGTPQKDTVMSDIPAEQASSPAAGGFAPSPAPNRTGTPVHGSRAASAHPDPGLAIPSEAAPNGDSARRYLNTKVTGALLEGMKQLAKEQPNEPLRVLGEFLIQKSRELEGTG